MRSGPKECSLDGSASSGRQSLSDVSMKSCSSSLSNPLKETVDQSTLERDPSLSCSSSPFPSKSMKENVTNNIHAHGTVDGRVTVQGSSDSDRPRSAQKSGFQYFMEAASRVTENGISSDDNPRPFKLRKIHQRSNDEVLTLKLTMAHVGVSTFFEVRRALRHLHSLGISPRKLGFNCVSPQV
jgi:hypothetical protein